MILRTRPALTGENYSQQEAELTLGLLKAVDGDDMLTQRSAARDLGVALGLVNTYLKRCVKKGLIKVQQVPSNRYAYYLTPNGFAEKSRLTAEFLSQSLNLFRQAQNDYSELLDICEARGWSRIALYGASDLAEILILYARDYPVSVLGIVDDSAVGTSFGNLPVVEDVNALGSVDVHIVTDLNNPQPIYDGLTKTYPAERIMAPKLLEISTKPKQPAGSGK